MSRSNRQKQRSKRTNGNGAKGMVWVRKRNSRKRVPTRSLSHWLNKGWTRD